MRTIEENEKESFKANTTTSERRVIEKLIVYSGKIKFLPRAIPG